jgi:hypothetical protein
VAAVRCRIGPGRVGGLTGLTEAGACGSVRAMSLSRCSLVRAALVAFVAFIAFIAASCEPAAPPAPPLEPEDFVPAGVPPDADSAEIRMSFGDPDSIVAAPHPYDAYTPVVSWYYRDLIVRYEGTALPASFLIVGGDESTLRGVRVGDAAERVLRLYGAPTHRQEPVWSYGDPLEDAGVNVIEFLMENDTVARIHLGRGAH